MNIQPVTPQCPAELYFVRKLEATAIELRELVNRFDDVTMLFRISQANENFAKTMEAGREVCHVADQIAFLAGGIKVAIDAVPREQEEFRR